MIAQVCYGCECAQYALTYPTAARLRCRIDWREARKGISPTLKFLLEAGPCQRPAAVRPCLTAADEVACGVFCRERLPSAIHRLWETSLAWRPANRTIGDIFWRRTESRARPAAGGDAIDERRDREEHVAVVAVWETYVAACHRGRDQDHSWATFGLPDFSMCGWRLSAGWSTPVRLSSRRDGLPFLPDLSSAVM